MAIMSMMDPSLDSHDLLNGPDSLVLNSSIRAGLAVVGSVALLSGVASAVLLAHLIFQVVRWSIKQARESSSKSASTWAAAGSKRSTAAPNQFLILIMNLLLADVQQAAAFVLNLEWVTYSLVDTSTATCWAQGWFVSVGDLSSSVFVVAIASHTYFAVVWGKQLSTRAFYSGIAALWGFSYGMALIGVGVTHARGQRAFTRAGAWCWISS